MHVVLVGAELEENLALRYLAGALERAGHRATLVVFDAPRDVERAAREIAASDAPIAGYSMVFTHRAREFAELAGRARELGYRGLAVAGGHFAAFHARELLRDVPAIDAVAIGEGESILCELAERGADPAAVAGLVWRDGQELRHNAPACSEQELDRLAWPTRKHPPDRYHGLPIVNMLGSRGCSYRCSFCSIAAWHKLCGGDRYRYRSAAGVAAEMGCLYREGVRLFNFHDDNFLGADRSENVARANALADELERQGVGKIAFAIKARPDAVDEETFGLLREMGLFRVFLGIEAGTELSLRNLGRGQKLADNERALAILEDLDLHVAYNLLVLNPESVLEDLEGNVAFMRRHANHPLNFCRTEIYTGTPLEKRLREKGRLRGDYWGLDYTIADERVERAFELVRVAFWDRNFGPHPLHYLSSQVDYEHQVRMDFFGTTPSLRAATKGFIRAVNNNTVDYLEEICAAVRAGRADKALGRELAARVARDDRRMHAEGQALLARLRQIEERRSSARARAVFAASVALTIAGCRTPAKPQPQPMEAAPPWTGAPPDPTPTDPLIQDAPDAGTTATPPPTQTYPMEAAPPPTRPQPMEAAPRWPAPDDGD